MTASRDPTDLLLSILDAKTPEALNSAIAASRKAMGLTTNGPADPAETLFERLIPESSHHGASLRAGGMGRIRASTTEDGIMLDVTQPGTDGPFGIGIELDRGSVHITLFRPGEDELQADIHLDERGVHVADGPRSSEGFLFRGESTGCRHAMEWEPEKVEVPSP